MNRKVLFCDLDGTLLNDEKNITPGNRAAIDQMLENGHIFVISTGRPLVGTMRQAERLGLTIQGCYAITFNGGQIYDIYNKKTVYGKALPRSLVRPLFDAACERGIHIQTYDHTAILSEQENESLYRYAQINRIPYKIVKNIETALTEDPYKLICINYEDRTILDLFQQEIISRYKGQIHSFFSNDWYLEIVPDGISKGFAVEWMCRYLGIPLENSVAAGDAQNDIAMLEAAHVGAVMCNAFPGIAEHGNYITEADNNHDGVAEIIQKFIL